MKNNEIIERVLKDPRVRIETARQSFEWFFNIYLSSYIKYETAPFQKKMFEIAGDENELLSVIVAFRGSAKTTIMSLAYPIWAILGRQQKKFVVIIGSSHDMAMQRLANIRMQFEQNGLLRQELGPFKDDSAQWGAGSIVLPKYGARITVASRDQSIRGITHNHYRPDLIVLDDVEDSNSVRTKEGRNKMHEWFHNDIIPLGTPQTKIIVIGNLLHEDSLVMRLKQALQEQKMSGRYYEFPIRIGDRILWPDKYPDLAALERERKRVGDERAWQQEYELRIVSKEDQVIFKEWIHYYDGLPATTRNGQYFLVSAVDLALSDRDSADFTAIVSAQVLAEINNDIKIFIQPHPVNKRLSFPEQEETIENINRPVSTGNSRHYIYIESVGYQGALVQSLVQKGLRAEGVTPQGSKRERLTYISPLIKSGVVLFPRQGAEDLITQLVGFGVEKHDDLADALSLLVSRVMTDKKNFHPRIRISPNSRGFWAYYGRRYGL